MLEEFLLVRFSLAVFFTITAFQQTQTAYTNLVKTYSLSITLQQTTKTILITTTTGGGDGSEGGDVDAEYGVGDEHEQVLDLPPSWVSKLAVERERYRLKYSTIGSNVKLYKRCKVELYAGKYSKAKESVHRVYGKAL